MKQILENVCLLFGTENFCRLVEVCRTDTTSATEQTQNPYDGSGKSFADTKRENL